MPRNPLIHGPILGTLLRLATPNILAMVMFVAVGITETWYIGKLGTTPLAAMALVFPFAMLTGMLSGGAMGGGVSSSIARALGAGDLARANALARHALYVGGIGGVVYSALMVGFGPTLYRLLGGQGEVLAQAERYGAVLFSGALFVWLINTLAAVVRGTGNMRIASIALVASAVLQIALGGALCLGWGPLPSLGMIGVAIGHIVSQVAGVALLLWYLRAGHGRLTMRLAPRDMNREMFWDILRVGAVACLSPLQSVTNSVIVTGLIARLGVPALAGFGIGIRLEFMLTPIAFGFGVAAVPMVGMAIGAGNIARARRVAWTAGLLSAACIAAAGIPAMIFPTAWAGLFTSDPAVLEMASLHLRWAGLAFPIFGLGLTMYFAAQGAGKVGGPVLASTLRLVLVTGVGLLLNALGAPAWTYFGLVALGLVTFGAGVALAVRVTDWTPRR